VHEISFADAVRPTPVVVLKLPLRPYSLGHEALLWHLQNPLLTHSWSQFNELSLQQQINSVLDAVWICANTWKQNQGEPFRRLKLKIWRWRLEGENFPLGIAEFRNYLAAGRKLPNGPTEHALEVLYPKDEIRGRAPGSALLAQLYSYACSPAFAIQRQSADYADERRFLTTKTPNVWDLPYSMVGHLYFTAMEMEGNARIENTQEREEQAELDKINREIAEEKSKGQKSEARGRKSETAKPTRTPSGRPGGASLPDGLATEVPEELRVHSPQSTVHSQENK
jgi:hypothetical protein